MPNTWQNVNCTFETLNTLNNLGNSQYTITGNPNRMIRYAPINRFRAPTQVHLDQPKSGFGLPVHRWLRRHPEVLRDAVRRLMDRGVLARPVGPEFRRAWSLLVLDRWFEAVP